jgi:hypothetical protein
MFCKKLIIKGFCKKQPESVLYLKNSFKVEVYIKIESTCNWYIIRDFGRSSIFIGIFPTNVGS